MDLSSDIAQLKSGGIIVYPTEAVFGLGCDPLREDIVAKLLKLKLRSWKKGLILIGSDWDQFVKWVMPIPDDRMKEVMASWPGPVTWLFPAAPFVPAIIHGEYTTVAIRVTAHPIAKQLCEEFGGPLVSTSANVEGQAPARTLESAQHMFGDNVAAYIAGEVDTTANPSEIRDAISGKVIRVR